jgi:DNA-binding NarL/FixJ family response regulator
MIQVARGRLSKQIAGDIGIAQATVKVRRSRAMRKMNARSLPEFGQMAAKLNLVLEKSQRAQPAELLTLNSIARLLDHRSAVMLKILLALSSCPKGRWRESLFA